MPHMEYVDYLIDKAIELKKQRQFNSHVLQIISLAFSITLFLILGFQMFKGQDIGVSAVIDLAGASIVILSWASARSAWRESVAYSLRAGQFEDLKLSLLMSKECANTSPKIASQIIMSLRRDQIAKHLDLDEIFPRKAKVSSQNDK